jgi:hypothetical protein
MVAVSRFAAPQIARYIGKCASCKTVRAFDAPRADGVESPYAATSDRDGTARRVVIGGRSMVVVSRKGTFRAACGCPTEQPGWAVEYKQIRGTVDPTVKCGGRCTHARGQSCTCECGGANHGVAHS